MNWKSFITPIQKSKISSDAAYKILLDLFEQAGSKNDILEATAKSWLSGTRNCKTSTYFPAGKIDAESLFRYFRNRPTSKLKQLQQMFQDEKKIDTDSPIDVETDDMDIFCWSLINQFLDLLGFQRVDLPHADAPWEVLTSNVSQPLNSQESDILKAIISGQEKCAAQCSKGRPSIRSTILPHSDDCCYHCTYWNGSRSTFGAYIEATYGVCIKHNRSEQLSSDLPCKDYKKRNKLSGEW